MKKITAITPQVKDKKRVNIFLDGEFYCGLQKSIYNCIFSPTKVGDFLFYGSPGSWYCRHFSHITKEESLCKNKKQS